MPNALFRFFEAIAEELTLEGSRVITRADLQLNDQHAPLLDELKDDLGSESAGEAVEDAVSRLAEHFKTKGSQLPFSYDRPNGRFESLDSSFLSFVTEMGSIRSIGKRSADFEMGVLARLSLRATGSLHRVGHPRAVKKKSRDFNLHLAGLGFNGKVLVGKDKDGGLDILWVLPLGSLPHCPIVSVQCKNGVYNLSEAYASTGVGSQSFGEHAGLLPTVHVPCVLFNDYLYPECLPKKKLGFVLLGTDRSGENECLNDSRSHLGCLRS